ncbi:ABC transporter ATP-binding protein [Methylobacterium ajmalii]|jgi:branched-chain amino acid transport system ATP-binding protein|uniref:ABC transporter ATP-binding protein n=1 Tax=Methylobacterium ajmalii TaxID=2738439 RepID=UPI00190D2446|nr:ABC transporter ATP-binding protein [Methylobacterium ajmalii]MBK3395082.1 ABC transporter ATP-binding protein [Methylobacterium ajmalii]MBK3410171.1 ABC transporter ATP-binding protein [Methylobacterium ajmalii]MBK3425757.1 ABC transporter ATP-binding protein [Methylobacterium ajmalii]MBZ6415423.1 ABC transporter ATP-binding protein [Methylobacterium sp.]
MTLLVVAGLTKRFGGVAAAKDVSFTLDAGEMLAIIGPNGAGKSTTFNMVGGQLRPDSGSITLEGASIAGLPARAIWKAGVGRTFQVAQTFVSMTVAENVQMALLSHHGRSRGLFRDARALYRDEALVLLAGVGMRADAERPVSELAYGDVKRVELAVALASRPKLLLMDEPTAGMAPRERSSLMALTAEVARARSIGVLYTEHDMEAVFAHADRVLVLVRGEIIAAGTPEEIRANPRVKQVYLGEAGTKAAMRARRKAVA